MPARTRKALLACLLSLQAACSPGSKGVPPPPRPVPVAVAAAVVRPVPVRIEAVGTVEASSTIAVRSRVDGTLAEVRFRDGQDVRKGQLLFLVDPRPFQAALRQSLAVLEKNRVLAENAQRDAERYAGLVAKDLVPREMYDRLRSQAESAKAGLSADRAAVENDRLRLRYCYIRSPVDGRIGAVAVDAGNTVKENDVPLAVIHRIRPAYVSFSVPQQRLPGIRRAARDGGSLPVTATVAGEERTEAGTLSFINNAVDNGTGTIRLRGTFANREQRLWPGQFVNVSLTLGEIPRAVTVPSRSIQAGQEGPFVFVVGTDNVARMRPVATGAEHEGATVVERGLAAGEAVVTDGQLRLAPGAKVAVQGGTAGPAARAPAGAGMR